MPAGHLQPKWYAALQEALIADPAVCLAYLFGSFSRGRQMPESDVDVGVYFYEPYNDLDQNRVWGCIEDITGLPVDLVTLNDAPPLIAAAAMEGMRMVIKDPYVNLTTWLRVSGQATEYAEFVDSFWEWRELIKEGRTQ